MLWVGWVRGPGGPHGGAGDLSPKGLAEPHGDCGGSRRSPGTLCMLILGEVAKWRVSGLPDDRAPGSWSLGETASCPDSRRVQQASVDPRSHKVLLGSCMGRGQTRVLRRQEDEVPGSPAAQPHLWGGRVPSLPGHQPSPGWPFPRSLESPCSRTRPLGLCDHVTRPWPIRVSQVAGIG